MWSNINNSNVKKTKASLTHAQAIVFVGLQNLIEESGQIPTVQELTNYLHMDSEVNGREKVCSHLRQLKLKGYVSTSGKGARNIKIK